MDFNFFSGNTYRDLSRPAINPAEQQKLIPIEQALNTHQEALEPVSQVKLITMLEQPYYLLAHNLPAHHYWPVNATLINANTGKIQHIDENFAQQIAVKSYIGTGKVSRIEKLPPPFSDVPKERNNLWRIDFTDDVATSVYINEHTGRIVAHVNDWRRFRDIMFMLHFMDYQREGSFNNVFAIVFGFIALTLSVSGMIWLVQLIASGQLRFSLNALRHKLTLKNNNEKAPLTPESPHQITINNHHGERLKRVELTEHQQLLELNLLDGLAQHNLSLTSDCGGGGSCGLCRVKLTKSSPVHPAEREKLSKKQLEQGVRLACQHACTGVSEVQLLRPLT